MYKAMMRRLFPWTLKVEWERSSRSTGWTLLFQRSQPDRRSSSMTNQRSCRCGAGNLCLRNCRGLEVWMSGSRSLPSFESAFLLLSKRSLSAGVTVFGFTIMACLRTLQGDITCFSSGQRLTSAILTILPSNVTSFFTWLRAKLIPVVSVSFILSVAVLGTLISVLLYLSTKLRRLKTSCLEYNRRLVRTLRKTSS